MTLPVFPTLPGLGWSTKKTPTFSTRVAPHVSGREVRSPNYAHGLYAFELTFDGLDSSGAFAGLQANSLQTLMGFYTACQGQFATFVYSDPTDNAAAGATFAIADGTTTVFTLYRPLGAFGNEPVSYATAVSSITNNGAAPGILWTFTAPNTITFASAPAAGSVLAWSGTYGFQCRFVDDSVEFENFMAGLWSVSSLKFKQVR
jgi:hypothetical protein